jgi:hypothetical protein
MTALGRKKTTELNNICKALRRPGGQIERHHVDGTVTLVNDPGIAIPGTAEHCLCMVAYIIREHRYIGRTTDPDVVTLDYIYDWEDIQESKDSHKEITTDPAITDFHKDWTKAFETMDMYFRQRLSEITKIPLSYLYRKEREVTPEALDPSTNYSSWDEEQVARCLHFAAPGRTTRWFATDNKKLWHILHSMFKGSLSYTHMKAFAQTTDGRGAYLALYDYYLGTRHTQNLSRKAEALLNKLRYTGETKRYNFHKYATQHKECHVVLNNLKVHGYSGIDEASKVRRFLDGIQYAQLENCKTQIYSTAALQVDFDGCVDLINNMIHTKGLSYAESSTQIAATTASKPGTKHNQGNSSGGGKKLGFAKGTKPGSTPHPKKFVQVEDRY